MKKQVSSQTQVNLITHPEELIYRSCYASANLSEMLQNAETRSRIRKLPPAQLFFSVKELDQHQIAELLPHITEAQWSAILDLDLWTKDEMSPERFVAWQQHILFSEDAVARKLLRASDLEAWAFTLKKRIQIFEREENDEFSDEALEVGQYETPDGQFMIALPRNAEKARLYQQLLQRLYRLEPVIAIQLIDACRFQTSIDLQEEAYQNRRRRMEDLGFQDYFEAIEIYSARGRDERLPKKQDGPLELGPFPATLPQKKEEGPMLLFRALAALNSEENTRHLIEELFFVCNKLLSADRVAPDQSAQVKNGILKTISCLNLGLESWSQGDLGRAVEGISNHYLLSFFQIGFGHLSELREQAKRKAEKKEPIPGSFHEAALEAMTLDFPTLAEQFGGRISTRFFQTEEDLDWGRNLIDKLSVEN